MSQAIRTVRDGITSQPQVLLMEDDSSVAQGLEIVLKEEGYGVDLATTGQGALETLGDKDFDLLVADLRLPDMDGMEVIRRVRDERPDTEVMVITGYATVPSAIEAMKRGVLDYLPKPFTEDEFMARVEALLKEKQEAISRQIKELTETAEAGVEIKQGEQTVRDGTTSQPQVLLMEDDSSVAQGLEIVLKEEGYGVDLATTGQGALETLGDKDFDLLVADLRLPDMDGMEVIRRVRDERPDTEVMVITGYSSVPSAVQAMRTGVSDYLSKPFTEEEFMATVQKAMKREKQGVISEEIGEAVETEALRPTSIGFYVCHCGNDISKNLWVDELVAFARRQPNVMVAKDYPFMCRAPGLMMIERDIGEFELNRVVVAGCSPGLYGKAFQEVCQRKGLSPHHFQMVPLREQVSWITQDPGEATEKGKILAAAAIHRVTYQRTLTSREVRVHPDVLVVGGGIAGMQAALDIAQAGHKAYLVERQSTIGGHMLQFDKTFPTLDCAACIGTPKMVSVGQDSNIELLTHSEVEEVSGFVGNYRVKIRRKPRYVMEGVCTGCGECADVCPVERPSEWDIGLGTRKAIYRCFPQAVPITFAIEKAGTAPCKATCPAHISVQGYIALVAKGKFREALKLIKEENPLPAICGRVCHHPCESVCTRGELDEPVAIDFIKRFVADLDLNSDTRYVPEIKDRKEHKVAIIGSGPAGLSCAYYLAREGYQVTIYEKLPVAGGMLSVGIPEYRLPREIIEAEIQGIKDMGVSIKTNVGVGEDITIEELREEGNKAIFICIGAHKCKKLGIKGEDLEGVLQGVDFLREVNLGREMELGNRVAVIGGGNVAMDSVRTALRLGSREALIIYRRSVSEMPASKEEIEECKEEGIEILTLTSPTRIIGDDGRVKAIKCIEMTLGEPDETGRRRPVPVEGSEFLIEVDSVIAAIGQESDWACLGPECACTLSDWGTMNVDPITLQTDAPDIFAGGDAVTGPRTVIEAIEAGKQAAISIDRFIQGVDLREGRGREWEAVKDVETEGYDYIPRTQMVCRVPDERVDNFREVQLGYSEEQAVAEAGRCLECGICSECYQCVEVCEAKAIDHSMEPELREIEVGSIIVATGYDLMDPTPMKQYGYGKYPNVFTSLEFERLNNATGPTDGQILMRDENGEFTKPPESVAIIHCVGSRDQNYHEYCSRVCCMYALKYGYLIKDKVGHHTNIYDFYVDMRCFGKGYEEFYRRCQEEGITFFRGKPAEITDQPLTPEEEGKLIVLSEDTLLSRPIRIPVDMVILCPAIEARKDIDEVARVFGIRKGVDGFFLEEHHKMAPLRTSTAGVFLAGTCQGPKDIPDTVAQASGAAAQALELAIAGTVELPSTIAWIDPDSCEGCLTCIRVCAYSAVDFDEQRGLSVINQAVCNGCGSCVISCPNGAAHIWQFREDQILTEFDGLIEGLQAAAM